MVIANAKRAQLLTISKNGETDRGGVNNLPKNLPQKTVKFSAKNTSNLIK